MGLTLRQLLCSGIAIGLAVLIYLWAKPLLGQETASWLCILAAAPIAAAGFLSYDGLPFEKFVIIVLESTILYSGWRVWKTELRPKQKGKVKKIAFRFPLLLPTTGQNRIWLLFHHRGYASLPYCCL